jgi:hypothetical protein
MQNELYNFKINALKLSQDFSRDELLMYIELQVNYFDFHIITFHNHQVDRHQSAICVCQ